MRKLLIGLLCWLCVPVWTQAQPPSLNVPYVSSAGAARGTLTMDSTSTNAYRIQMGTPGTITATPAVGGALAAKTTYYVAVTAVDPIGGETMTSAQSTCLTTDANLTCNLSWTAITGANSYWVYYGTTSALGKRYTTTTNSYALAADAGAAQAVPTAASAYRTSLGGATANWSAEPWYFPDGTAAASSMAFASEPGTGLYKPGPGVSYVAIAAGGTTVGAFTKDSSAYGLRLMPTVTFGWSPITLTEEADLLLSRESAAVLQMGLDAAGVTDQMFKGPDRITSDGLGGSVYFTGGRPRGASAGGLIGFQTAPPTTAGSAGVLEIVATIDTLGSILARESFDQPHLIRLSTTFAAKGLGDGATNAVLGSPPGVTLYREEQAKTVSSWVDTTGALNLDADAINDEGVEIALGDSEAGASGWIITGAATGGCFIVNFTLGDNAGTDQFFIGWRNVTAFVTDNIFSGYNEWAGLGINAVDGSIFANHEINGGAGSLSDDSGVNMADGETRTLKSCITGTSRVPTASYTANGGTTFTAITLTNGGGAQTTGVPMIPFVSLMNAASVDPGLFVNWWQITRP